MVLMSSLMAIIYIGKVIEMMCFKTSSLTENSGLEKNNTIKEVPLMMLVPLWGLIIISLYCGINGDFITDISSVAAGQLLGDMK